MIERCLCPAGPALCDHDITQEDLLCDDCRAGDCGRTEREERRRAFQELRELAEKLGIAQEPARPGDVIRVKMA